MKYLRPYSLFIILLIQKAYSKLLDSNDFGSDSENFNLDNSDSLDLEENANIHENYRPRHKYKAGSGFHELPNRIERSASDIQESMKNSRCAIMFKNNEPVGILQPFEDAFKFLPVNGEPTFVDVNPVSGKRQSIMDVLYPGNVDDAVEYEDYKTEEKVGFSDDKYPSIFAKFKIDSKLDKENHDFGLKRSMFKRDSETPSISETQLGSLKSTLSKMKSDDSEEVEEELKNILDDMGLIDDYPAEKETEAKRELPAGRKNLEDENLEMGTNKINLVKENQGEPREKRFDIEPIYRDQLTSITSLDFQVISEPTIRLFKPENLAKVHDDAPEKCKDKPYEVKIEKKRQDDNSSLPPEPRKKRGKYYSGNAMPLLELATVSLVDDDTLNKYEKRVEREIRDKIEKLKAEVKKEIEQLRKGKKSSESDDSKRKKRQAVNTLIDEENKDIDPTINDVGNQKLHVRRKRYVNHKFKQKRHKENNSTTNSTIQNENLPEKINKVADTVHRTRTLKQTDSDVKELSNYTVEHKIKKREVKNILEDFEDEGGDTEFNEDDSSFNQNEVDMPDNKNSREAVDSKHCTCDKNGENCKCDTTNSIDGNSREVAGASKHCTCDKNGENCKCDTTNSIAGNSLLNLEDYTNLIDKPLEKKATNKNCNCDKNGNNCKCIKQFSEINNPSVNEEYSDYNQYDDMHKIANERIYAISNKKRKARNDFNSLINNQVEDNDEDDYYSDTANLIKRSVKPRKSFENGEYYIDLHPDIYKLTPIENVRDKRDNFDTLVALHGGGPVRTHLVAIRQRSMLPHSRFRRRIQTEENQEPRQLIDMSEEELFGALPQSYEGELLRYKRVKREKNQT